MTHNSDNEDNTSNKFELENSLIQHWKWRNSSIKHKRYEKHHKNNTEGTLQGMRAMETKRGHKEDTMRATKKKAWRRKDLEWEIKKHIDDNYDCSGRLTPFAGWLQQLLWLFDLRLRVVPSWSRNLSPEKTKGHPSGRLHSDKQVSIRAKKHQVCILASVLETVYLTRVLGTLYIGWN